MSDALATRRSCVVIAAVTILAAIVLLLEFPSAFRTIATLLLVLYLPGRAVLQSAWPVNKQGLSSTALAVGISLTIAIGMGFALNGAGVLTADGWSIGLVIVALVACAANWLKPRAALVDDAIATMPLRVSAVQWAAFAVAAVVATGAVATARNGALAHLEYSYSEFWMVPEKVNPNIVVVGIRNAEKIPMSYDIALVADDSTIGRWPQIDVAQGEVWTRTIDLSAPLRKAERVEAWLIKSGDAGNVYRKVWLSKPKAADDPEITDDKPKG